MNHNPITDRRTRPLIVAALGSLVITSALVPVHSSHGERFASEQAAIAAQIYAPARNRRSSSFRNSTQAAASLQFSSAGYTVAEGDGGIAISVTRSGDTSGAVTIDYATSDGTASERSDFTAALGTLRFAAGETSKTFLVLITDDLSVEGSETLNLTLSNPTGGALLGSPSAAIITIVDNDTMPSLINPIDQSRFLVRQHYLDFLNREADASGFGFWTGEIDNCTPQPSCTEIKRINVSAAFYLSIEFQGTGYLVERIYKASYGDFNGTSTLNGVHQLPVPVVRFREFLSDTQDIGQGVVVNQGNWQQQLEDNKNAFSAEFVQRPRFTTAFPNSMTAAQFVDTLNVNAGNPLSPAERNQLVTDLSNNAKTRAQVLRAVAEDQDLNSAEFNRAFVLMQFFGYLRRNPNDPQDNDYTGYEFWLTKLNQFNGNFVNAEMVKAFISSTEYRGRFEPTFAPTPTPTPIPTPTPSPSPTPAPPPDPAGVAPPIDPTVATTIFDATSFLYNGTPPIQTGVAPGTIKPFRAAVVRGRVVDRNNAPLPGVTITILNHAEFGQTLSRADGMFDMVVNGGGLLTINYAKGGFLSAQRQATVPWQEYAMVEDVALLPYDNNVTLIDLSASTPVQIAQGGTTTDSSGSRRNTLMFRQGTTATMTLPNSSTQPLTTLHVRATEYTVGPTGSLAMPGSLPPASQYTYASEYSIDEAVDANATVVSFNQPVIQYNENFLNFSAGTVIPSGSYDKTGGIWIPSSNGLVIKILSITTGVANLDIDGSGNPASDSALTALGINNVERQQLAALYTVGQSLWRVPLNHFSSWDSNWGWGPPGDARPPQQPSPSPDKPCDCESSQDDPETDDQSQSMGQRVGLVGTPFFLTYRSDRQQGRQAAYSISIPLSGSNLPASLKRIDLSVQVGGRVFPQTFQPNINQTAAFTWDGKDAYGRTLQGSQPAQLTIGYVYDGVYDQVERFGYSGNGIPIAGDRTREEVSLQQYATTSIGPLDERGLGLGGWSLNIQHIYDPYGKILYRGDGGHQDAQTINSLISTVAGDPSKPPAVDGAQAINSDIKPVDVAAAQDGTLFIIDDNVIRKIDRNGIITKVAGNGVNGYSGDGGPATQALISPSNLSLGPDGSLYFYNFVGRRIRKIDPSGIITTVAGNGGAGFTGDGGPATQAEIGPPTTRPRVAFDGSLYFGDLATQRVRRVDPAGIITTVAGDGSSNFGNDGGPARQTPISVSDIALGSDGSVYIVDTDTNRIRRVTPDGIIKTVAGGGNAGNPDGIPATTAQLKLGNDHIEVAPDGTIYFSETSSPGLPRAKVRRVGVDGILSTASGNGTPGFAGDGGPAPAALVSSAIFGLSLGPDGSLYTDEIAPDGHQVGEGRIRRIAAPLPGFTGDQFAIPSPDGEELYQFDANGRHLRTVNTLTGANIYVFGYDSGGRLAQATDGDGNVTTIERDGSGKPTGIVSQYGQRTALTLDSNGYINGITDPAQQANNFVSSAGGLITAITDPRGNNYTFQYDSQGRLTKETDPASGTRTFARTDQALGYNVALTTALNRIFNYRVQKLLNGDLDQFEIEPSGLQTLLIQRGNGVGNLLTPDGTIGTRQLAGDPRFGIIAPVVSSDVTATPGGLNLSFNANRTATLSDPNNPFSLSSLTDTLSINGQTYTSVFNPAGRAFTVSSPLNRQATAIIDVQGRTTQFQFANLSAEHYSYDNQGRLISATFGAGAEARTANFTYNSSGFLSSFKDPLGRTESYTYDPAGRLTQKALPDGRVITFAYDANGNLTSLTPPGRSAHSFTFTPVDLGASYTAPNVGGGSQTTNAYNLDRQLTTITRPDALSLNLTYDSAGRLSGLTIPGGQYSYAYNATTGNLSTLTAPGGGTLSYSYDGFLPTGTTWAGTVAGSVSGAFDNDFRLASQNVNGGNTITFTYDNDSLLTGAGDLALNRNAQNGLLTGTTLSNITDTVGYNNFAEPISYSASFDSTSLYQANYTRDKLGRITQKTETIGGATNTYAYAYDQAGRLSTVTLNAAGTPFVTYSYDSNSNRTTANFNGTPINGTYDAQDRLTQYGVVTYSYTANGELQSETTSGQTTTYTYDVVGNLKGVTRPSGPQIDYVIDGQNRRIGRKVNGTLAQGFLYEDQLRIVAELDGSNNIVSRFVYGSRRSVPDYMIKGGVTYRIISDNLGSPRLVVDVKTGTVAQEIDYDEFGGVMTDTSPGFQPFGFAGGLYDKDTGLVRFGARDYDPGIGRWTAKDPSGFAGGGLNLYLYSFADPLNTVDPSGLSSFNDKLLDLLIDKGKDLPTDYAQDQAIKGLKETNPELGERVENIKNLTQPASDAAKDRLKTRARAEVSKFCPEALRHLDKLRRSLGVNLDKAILNFKNDNPGAFHDFQNLSDALKGPGRAIGTAFGNAGIK